MSQPSPSMRAPATNWRRILVAVCIAQATAIIGFDFTLPFIPLYLQHDLGVHGLGQTAFWAGLIGFGPAIPATICAPLWGRLADRFGYRAMLIRAMLSSAILLVLMGFVPNPTVLLVLRMLQGALSGTVFSSQALVASSVPERETARSIGLLQMSIYLGATIGPVGGGAVADVLGFRAAFFTAGILLMLASIVVFVFVTEPGKQVARRTREASAPSIRSVLMIPAFAASLTLTLVVQLSGTSLFPVLPLYVQDLLRSGRDVASDTGWLMALSGIAGAVGSYTAARLHRMVGLKVLLITSLGMSAVLIVPQAFAGDYSTLLILRSICALMFGALTSLVGTWAASTSPSDAKGTAFGLLGAASSMGFGAGPLMGGAFAATFGIRPLFVVSGIALGLVPLLLFALVVTVSGLSRRVQSSRALDARFARK